MDPEVYTYTDLTVFHEAVRQWWKLEVIFCSMGRAGSDEVCFFLFTGEWSFGQSKERDCRGTCSNGTHGSPELPLQYSVRPVCACASEVSRARVDCRFQRMDSKRRRGRVHHASPKTIKVSIQDGKCSYNAASKMRSSTNSRLSMDIYWLVPGGTRGSQFGEFDVVLRHVRCQPRGFLHKDSYDLPCRRIGGRLRRSGCCCR